MPQTKEERQDFTRKWKKQNRNVLTESNRSWRKQNPEKVRRHKEKDEKKRKRYIATLARYKLMKGCCLCGFQEAAVALEFHHTDPKTKKFAMSMGWSRRKAAVKEEIRKCIVVCSNCHRRVESGEIASPKGVAECL